MKTEPVNGTVYECPYCHGLLKEDVSFSLLGLKCVDLKCLTCRYAVRMGSAKEAYRIILEDETFREAMNKNADNKDSTVYECPYCHKQMKEDWSHFVEYKRVMLYCNDCRYGVFGKDPKDAYAFLMRKDDKDDR